MWCFLVGMIILFGVLTIFLHEIVFIVATSIIGGYCMIRAISFVAGDYPNEFTIVK